MKKLLVVAATLALTGCGVETATTAASVAAMKKQEIEQGKKTMERAQQKINASMEQVQQSSQAADQQ
jgi:curli biogenesis system outer membrane secretion channel CsgG